MESFDIVQPLTTTLRGLLAVYPPGPGILKELLQNADDAGASKLTYLIDCNTYPTERLADMSLGEYQGPALLAYNNAVFSQTDFESLRRLGDSEKLKDKMSTGKFGIGFSSVYGWTDSPSILTDRYFLALSPHLTLTTYLDKPGLKTEFTRTFSQIEDQLLPFRSFGQNFSEPFPGTVIRIPLRTVAQAKTSKITNVTIQPESLVPIFAQFQEDVLQSLPFLKNIEEVTFRINDSVLCTIRISNLEEVRTQRARLKTAIAGGNTISSSFPLSVCHHYSNDAGIAVSAETNYLVRYHITDFNGPASSDFRSWLSDAKYYPWVSLAAPLHPTAATTDGRIFVTLPLPLTLQHTVINIHGIFALSRDRRSLWNPSDLKNGGPTNEITWNKFLFERVIPSVWTELLEELARSGQLVRQHFPLILPGSSACGSLFENLGRNVVHQALEGNSKIWRSNLSTFLALDEGYMIGSSLSAPLLDTLQELSMPILTDIPYEWKEIIRESKHPHKVLNAEEVRRWLRTHKTVISNDRTAAEILRFVIGDKLYHDLYDLPLFPCLDGQYRSLSVSNNPTTAFDKILFIGGKREIELFTCIRNQFLDLSRLDSDIMKQIKDDITIISTVVQLKQFDLSTFRLFALSKLYSSSSFTEDELDLNKSNIKEYKWFQSLWDWLDEHKAESIFGVVNGLYLIPLENRKLRKKLIMRIHDLTGGFPLVSRSFHPSENGYLRNRAEIASLEDIEAILKWITPKIVANLPGGTRDELRQHLAGNTDMNRRTLPLQDLRRIKMLPIFKKLDPSPTDFGRSLTQSFTIVSAYGSSYISLLPSTQTFVTVGKIGLPLMPNVVFLDASGLHDSALLSRLGHAPVSHATLISRYIIPNLDTQPESLLDSLVQDIFEHASHMSPQLLRQLSEVKFATVRSRSGNISPERVHVSQTVSEASSIAKLFFDDEHVFGDGIYAAHGRYKLWLDNLGMKRDFDQTLAEDRIRSYASREFDNDLFDNSALLIHYMNKNDTMALDSDMVKLLRVPAIHNGRKCLLPVSKCRPQSRLPLVGNVLGIASVEVTACLSLLFGWSQLEEAETLGLRITEIIESSPACEVETDLYPIIDYLNKVKGSKPYITRVREAISVSAWLPDSNGSLVPTDKIFLEDVSCFEPYLNRISGGIRTFKSVLRLFGVHSRPAPADLLFVLNQFPSADPIKSHDLKVVISILRELEPAPDIDPAKLLIPDTESRLYRLEDFRERKLIGHMDLPKAFCLRYEILSIDSDLASLKYLNDSNHLFDDYCQEEKVTTRISSLLSHSLSTSFNEFLANAEDSGSATTVSWFLDPPDAKFPQEQLISEELKDWQIPSLYVFNDGEFADTDFKALIQIGAGTKARDSSKIGKFGLGSLAMYQFTDVPSMISGRYFIIFDPSRKFLPLCDNKRRAGLRCPLEFIRKQYPDMIRPFIGINDYSLDQNSFNGTIFRFPLRTSAQYADSPLAINCEYLDWKKIKHELDNKYFEQAKQSLVFLKDIHTLDFYIGHGGATRHFNLQWQVNCQRGPWIEETPRPSVPLGNLRSQTAMSSYRKETLSGDHAWIIVGGSIPKNFLAINPEIMANSKMQTPSMTSIPHVALATVYPSNGLTPYFYNSLPLPVATGLPVSCHGFFITTPDRRSLRRDGGEGSWNEFLERKYPKHRFNQYYSLWPSAENLDLRTPLASSFWDHLPKSSESLILNRDGKRYRFGEVIFDTGVGEPQGMSHKPPILDVVRKLQSSHVVYIPSINKYFSRNPALNFRRLTPALVRSLLKTSEARTALSQVSDGDLKIILSYIVEENQVADLVNCVALRNGRGEMMEIPAPGTNELHIIDESGFNLFKDISGRHLIKPSILSGTVRNLLLNNNGALNIKAMVAGVVDRSVEHKIQRGNNTKQLTESESEWINMVWRYVYGNKFDVSFFNDCPTIPLLPEDRRVFVSRKGLRSLPIMPPQTSHDIRRICEHIPGVFFLASPVPDRVKDIVKGWNIIESFLHCLSMVPVNGVLNLVQSDNWAKMTLRDICLQAFNLNGFNQRDLQHASRLRVFKGLPLWKSINGEYNLAAQNSFILPSGKPIFPDLEGSNSVFILDGKAEKVAIALGATRLSYKSYLMRIFRALGTQPPPSLYIEMQRLLSTILSEHTLCHDFQDIAVVPDCNGVLKVGRLLYNPGVPLFASAFREENCFVHPRFAHLDLRSLGVHFDVNYADYVNCVSRVESRVPNGFSYDLWQRACDVWQYLATHNRNWSSYQLRALSSRQFVPVIEPWKCGYRHKFLQREPNLNQYAITSMGQGTVLEYSPICWTQMPLLHLEPISSQLLDLPWAPHAVDVARHLIELATTVANECTARSTEFFSDLQRTYNYLNQTDNLQIASDYLRNHHADKTFWLNEEFPSGEQFRHPDRPISEMKWLKSNRIIHGVSYDIPRKGIYHSRGFLKPFGNLLRACGSLVLQDVEAQLNDEDPENHGNKLLLNLREMLDGSEDLRDLVIVVEGQRLKAHRVILGAVSLFFRSLASKSWTESRTGVLNLDKTEKPFYNAAAVRSVINWVYGGSLELENINWNEDCAIEERIELYLDVLQLANMWIIPDLRLHVENHLLRAKSEFIRLENVMGVRDIARIVNAEMLLKYCENYIQGNHTAVEVVASLPDDSDGEDGAFDPSAESES